MKLQAVTKGNGFPGSLVFLVDMNYKKEIERRLRYHLGTLRLRTDHSSEEITRMGGDIPLKVMKDPDGFVRYVIDRGFGMRDAFVISSWIGTLDEFLNSVEVDSDISYHDAMEAFEQARTGTIIIHRVNYILHECMIQVYDTLERDRRLRFNIKDWMKKAERIWDNCYHIHSRKVEKSALNTLQDHLRLSCDAVSPLLEKVYESIRDYLIYKGQRDVEVKARCLVVLLMGKVAVHTYRAFFRDFRRECGVDFTNCYSDDSMLPMIKCFASMCCLLGMRTDIDSNGCYVGDVSIEESQRFKWAWKEFMLALRDDELMDEAARKAIEYNPKVQEEYQKVLEDEERKQADKSAEMLSGKFKVKRV